MVMIHFPVGACKIITCLFDYVILRYFAYHIHIGYDITSISYMPSIIGQITIHLVNIGALHYHRP